MVPRVASAMGTSFGLEQKNADAQQTLNLRTKNW